MVELTVLGISTPQSEDQAPVLLLHPLQTDLILSMMIGPMEAFSISMAMTRLEKNYGFYGTAPEAPVNLRPMTHDFTISVINGLQGKLEAVEILSVEDGIYMAEAVINSPSGKVRIDCRPSDGVALAVRCGASIKASKKVLEGASNITDVLAQLPDYIRQVVESNMLKGLTTAAANGAQDQHMHLLQNRLEGMAAFFKKTDAQEAENTGETKELPKRSITIKIKPDLLKIKTGKPAPIQRHVVIAGAVSRSPIDPASIMNSLGEDATDDERWTELLKLLSPDIKTPM